MGARGAWHRNVVAETAELRRIRALPRRTWNEADLSALASALTERLKMPRGEMSLRPVQALALHDIETAGGLFGPIRVGGGKTLVSLLAPYILGARKPLLLLPAALVDKTRRELRALARHWKIPNNLQIQSYEMLSREGQARFLDVKEPDLIVADEAHRLKNKRAGVTRRVVRYMREHPATRFVAISGTVLTNSLRDFAHILRWCLKGGAPIPKEDGEVEEWADALDEKVQPLKRADPGALLTLCGPEDRDLDELTAARRAFRRRLTETAGVVTTAGETVACSLYIAPVRYQSDPIVDQHFHTLRSKWETPDGWALSEAIAVWRHARELALGLHYVWDPRPPEEWLLARREWAKFVRDTISHSRTLDTELQVARACEAGVLGATELDAWRRIRPSFTPVPRPVWHCSSALDLCKAWLEKNPHGIAWVEHTFFAHELARRTGLPYFGQEGKDRRGRSIEDADGPVIASVASNATGRNLQKWNANLITSCPGTATLLEQLIGRTHRDGQTADEVSVDILLGCWEHWNSFETARAGARMAQDMLGQPQKILLADVEWPDEGEILRLPGARWTKTVAIEKDSAA